MDVSLVPAITTPSAPAQNEPRAVPAGDMPFGSALASALRETAQADRSAAAPREAQGPPRIGLANTLRDGGAVLDEPANAAKADDDTLAAAASAAFALFGVPCPPPPEVPRPPVAPESHGVFDSNSRIGDLPATEPPALAFVAPDPVAPDHAGAERPLPGKATEGASGIAVAETPADTATEAAAGADGNPTPDARKSEANGMADWLSTRAAGHPTTLPPVAHSKQTYPGQASVTRATAASGSAGTVADGVGPLSVDPARVELPKAAADGTFTRRAHAAAKVDRQVASALQGGRPSATPAVDSSLVQAAAPPTAEAVAPPHAVRTDPTAVAAAVQKVLQDDDTILAFPDGEPTQVGVSLDVQAIARAAVGSGGNTDARRPRDDEGTAERGPARHAAASAVAAYIATRAPESEPVTRLFESAASPVQADEGSNPTANGEPLQHAIVKSLRLQWSQGAGEARLQLKPEYLGELTVALKVQGTMVTAVLQSDSAAVRSWVEEHQGELRRALEDVGLSLDRLVIDADGESSGQQPPTPDERRQSQPRRNTPPGRFEALL